MRKNNADKYINNVSLIIVFLVFFLSIGWAAFNSSLQLDGVTMVRVSTDIRVTDFKYIVGSTGVLSSNEDYNVDCVFGTVSLPNNDSTAKYKIEITNMQLASNVHMAINSLTGLPDNLKIISIEDYSLQSKICDDNDPTDCGTAAQKTFYVTIGYKDNASYDANNTIYNFNLDVEFKRIHDIIYTGFTNPPITPTTVMHGETVTINFSNDANNTLNVISGGSPLAQNVNYTYQNHVLTFITPIVNDVYIVNPTTYTITYELNGGVQASGQITTYSASNNESILAPTKSGFTFGGWYTSPDFSSEVISNTSQLNGNVTLYASWGGGIAKIGNTFYNTLQEAVNAVPANNTETTIILLSDTAEFVNVVANKNIVFNLQNYTLSNSETNPVIDTSGTIKITNGTITSNTSQGAVNVRSTGKLIMTGGSIIATGSKQAVYNEGGIVEISGSSFLKTTSNQRATVHNKTGGTLTITG